MFNRLPAGSQVEVLAKKGTVLAQREHKEWTITLFSLNNYFVELWEKKGLELIGTFHKTVQPLAILEPYMDDIEIQDFFEI
jgi:hypothetical protein